jgi:23S rRNA (guanosine2251-2'-O)-methyltransferase
MKTQAAKKSKTTYLYGKHALAEALRKRPECIGKVFLSAQFDDTDILGLLKKHHIPYSALSKNTERSLGDDASHQGVIATFAPEKLMVSFSDFIESFPGTPDTALVLLDELEDPHNVGAVIRSAAAFGIAGVLIPEHRQAPITVAQVLALAAPVEIQVDHRRPPRLAMTASSLALKATCLFSA